MSYTPAEYAEGVWTHPVRTLDPGVPAPSDGTYIDDVAYAVWTYVTRTASGGVPVFSITVAETLPAPSQGITAQTVMPVTVSELLLAPSQVITAEASEVVVKKPLGAGGPRGAWDYYPPILTIRTDVEQSAPPPRQAGKLRTNRVAAVSQIILPPTQKAKVRFIKKEAFVYGHSFAPAPGQSCDLWPHRLPHVREAEERKIILMLLGFDVDEYEYQMKQPEAVTDSD